MRAVRDGLVPMADILNIQQIGDEPIFGVEGDPLHLNNVRRAEGAAQVPAARVREGPAKNNQTMLYMVPWPTQYLHLKIKAEYARRR